VNKSPIIGLTLLTLGSGLFNLYSALGHGHRRLELLRPVIPVEFIQLSHSIALLAGFALVISSFSIYKRKRRAFWIVAFLSLASMVAHLARGLHYEQAAMSAGLIGALFLQRRRFTVRSREVDWKSALGKTCIAFILALSYGVTGFWLLDPRHFGIDFRWKDALEQSVRILLLSGDDGLIPRTFYAQRFLQSLHLLAYSAVVYGLFVVFRPAMYRFRTQRHEIDRARRILAEHGRSSIDFFKVQPDKSFFFSGDGSAFLSYAVAGNFALVLGDPVGPPDGIARIVRDFSDYCQDNDWRFGFYQTLPDFLNIYENEGLKKLQIGEDAVVDLQQFTLEGRSHKSLRTKVNQLDRSGLYTEYYEPPLPPDLLDEVKRVSDEWLRIPGRHERQFSLGSFEPDYVRSTPVFAVHDESGSVLAFANIIPSYRTGEATVDLMRRRTEAPNGVMDYLFAKLLLLDKQMGYRRFNLGMAPMAGFHAGESASMEERAIHTFFQHAGFLFSFKGLFAFKAKFATSWEPAYVVYRSALDLPKLGLALRRVSKIDSRGIHSRGETCGSYSDSPARQFALQR
jgi:phosphatidylglycerol lysyltransferase